MTISSYEVLVMGPFRTLYLDMNSFFASVEQQLDPTIRGRPVAITAMENEKGCCVAASYEAKAFGIKTGTSVPDARRLCPGIVFLPSRHRLYVRYNLRVAAVLDRFAELERIRSVDEFQLGLSGEATTLPGARDLVTSLKAAVAAEVGACLRFSAGIGPNHLLAKIAGKLEKPDGCQWLGPENMPDRIAHLALDDLPGISRKMRARLEAAGITTMTRLCQLDPRHARAIWRSVEGERFVRALQGEHIPLLDTQRGGYGNSKVLAPEFRRPQEAYMVSRWLIEKATARLRRDGRTAARFTLQLAPMGAATIAGSIKCAPSQDTLTFMRINRGLWRAAWPKIRHMKLAMIGVNLTEVEMLSNRSGDLLRPLRPGELSRAERASKAADFINARFGAGTISLGLNQPHPGFFERG
ncbi:DNA polymerase Y family protein [Pseudogemmobacter faecipullorum]